MLKMTSIQKIYRTELIETHALRELTVTVGDGEFVEVFVDTPLAVCEERDPKGLYSKARAGLIRNFTGIDSSYEAPEHPELSLGTTDTTPEDLAEAVLAELKRRHVV